MKTEELKNVLEEHQKYLMGEGGTRANLRSANLYGVNLYGVNLRSADLRSADLSGANLYGANLYGADLSGADLYGADLYGADLSESRGIVWADCSWSGHGECGRRLLAAKIGEETLFFCGCFRGTEMELRAYIESGSPEYRESRMKALNFILDVMPRTV